MKKYCLFFVILLFLLTSCHKEVEPDNPINDQPIIEQKEVIENLELNVFELTLHLNETYQLSYSIVPNDYEIKNISWKSYNEDILSIVDGKLTALKPGVTAVSLNIDDYVSTIKVQIIDDSFYGPAPKVIDLEGLTYINGILIVNKTYSLPKEYNPNGLDDLVKTAFNAMAKKALDAGIKLKISSGYRSYSFQDTLYHNYVKIDGSIAVVDRYSARPGHSEHQTGLAIDIVDDKVDGLYMKWGKTFEGQWVKEHCSEFGFIIRYPEGKEEITGYNYEPWHLRYIGTKLAKEVTKSGLTLEEYLNIDSKYQEN